MRYILVRAREEVVGRTVKGRDDRRVLRERVKMMKRDLKG